MITKLKPWFTTVDYIFGSKLFMVMKTIHMLN